MIPLYGADVYQRLRAANPWVDKFLPNAAGPPKVGDVLTVETPRYRPLLEVPLCSSLGSWIDRREMSRMGRKLRCAEAVEELSLSPERCKGHVSAHGHKTLDAFASRVNHT